MITLEKLLETGVRVKNLLNRGALLDSKFADSTTDDGILVTNDPEIADQYSWRQDVEEMGFDPTVRYKRWLGNDFEFWPTLRELENARILEGQPRIQERVSKYLSDIVWNEIKIPLDIEAKLSTLRDELYVDLENALLNEYLGSPSALFEKILSTYENGGWPCGWLGKYPAGKLIVFDPAGNSLTEQPQSK